VGVVLGLAFVEPDIPSHFAVFFEDYDISLSLPQIDLSRVQAEWKRLLSTIPEPWKLNTDGREFQVGDAIKARGLEANHPVILIPGVISTVYILPAVLFLVQHQLRLCYMPSPEPRVLVNVTGVSRVLSPKGMGRIPYALSSDFQSREVDVDACSGPCDWLGPERGEGSSFGRV
jgi:hypothetical protein